MRGLFTKELIRLNAGDVLSGTSAHPQVLHIKSGCAWITIAGIQHDYWLSTGDVLQVKAGDQVVIEAESSGLEARSIVEARIALTAFEQACEAARGLCKFFMRKRGNGPAVACPASARCCA